MTQPRTSSIVTNSENDKSSIIYKADKNYVFQRGFYENEVYEKATKFTNFLVNLQYLILTISALFNELLRNFGLLKTFYPQERPEQKDFTKLYAKRETIFVNNCYRPVCDIIGRPIAGVPGTKMTLKDRVSKDYNWTFE
uniref:Uncharacterized protein n=1 Tax=Panagrolaimus sp. JU765 TaxID=591449 RepID=A0AC34RM66_9BILA